ncbi:MinD/ParA family protein [Paractinoplanes deccanensis]
MPLPFEDAPAHLGSVPNWTAPPARPGLDAHKDEAANRSTPPGPYPPSIDPRAFPQSQMHQPQIQQPQMHQPPTETGHTPSQAYPHPQPPAHQPFPPAQEPHSEARPSAQGSRHDSQLSQPPSQDSQPLSQVAEPSQQGPQPFPPDPQPHAHGPQPFPPDPQPHAHGPQPFPPGPQSHAPGPQPFPPGPQSHAPGPQPFPPGPQSHAPGPQPFPPGPQAHQARPPAQPHPPMPQSHPQVQQPHPQPPQPGGPSQPPTDPFQDLPWVSDGTPTAEEFARRRLAKPAEPVAKSGLRGAVNNITGGLVKLAPGRHEVERKQDVEMVRRNFGGLRQVTVVNPKGGAGKTVAVLLLAMTFGQNRGGYVLAWDNNETQGTLGMRAQQDFHARTVRDMMRDLHLFRGAHGRVGDLSQYVRAQGEGMFDVLASDESATAGEMLTADAFAEIREIVSRFYKLIFVDTGNNVRAQNWQAAMDATDQLVITMSARNDSAETAARMLDHLEQSGRQRLVRQAVSVVSMPPTRKDIDLPAIQRHFAARTRAVLLAPYEKLIDSGEPLRYGSLSSNTRDAWLKIAAAVAEGL